MATSRNWWRAGLPRLSVDRLFGRSSCDGERAVVDGCFELNESELAERALTASPVVGPFNPGHNRELDHVTCLPSPAVEHVLLQAREERLHRRVVARGGDAARGSGEPVGAQPLLVAK